MQVQTLSAEDDSLARSALHDDAHDAGAEEDTEEQEQQQDQASETASTDAIADASSGALAMGIGPVGDGLAALKKALKLKGLPSIYKGVPTAGPLARTTKPSLARRAGGTLGKAVRQAKNLTRGGSTTATTGSSKVLGVSVAAGSELKRGGDGGIENDLSVEFAVDIEPIPLGGVPGAMFTMQPSFKGVVHGVVGDRGVTKGKAEIEGSALIAFKLGIPDKFEAYAGFNAKVTGGAELTLDAPNWDLVAEVAAASNWQLGVKLFGNESTFKFPELKIATIDGMNWGSRGSKFAPQLHVNPELLEKLRPATKALEEAKQIATGNYDPTRAANWIRKRFGF